MEEQHMDQALQATTLTVTGMTCSGCASKVDKALRGLEGVRDISLHYPDTTVGVLHSASVTPEIIRETVTSLGFEVAAA
jgi:copper chaperone CopZ